MNSNWTDNEIVFLKNHYEKVDFDFLIQTLGRSKSAIKSKAHLLDLKRNWDRHNFTHNDDDFIKENYPNLNCETIAKVLGVSISSIYNRAAHLKVTKSEAFWKSECSGRTNLIKAGLAFRYHKGHIPQNKGKGMAPEVREKVKHTWFPKGNLPHNIKAEGSERITVDGYCEVRISKSNWKLKHRIVWQAAKGDIPKGFNIVFKDNNRLNCAIENLEIISHSELMGRNTIHRYPEDLQTAFRSLGKLNQKIRKYEKQD